MKESARATEMASPYESASLGTSGAHLLPFGVQNGAPCAIVMFGSLRTCSVTDVASAGVGQDMPSPSLCALIQVHLGQVENTARSVCSLRQYPTAT